MTQREREGLYNHHPLTHLSVYNTQTSVRASRLFKQNLVRVTIGRLLINTPDRNLSNFVYRIFGPQKYHRANKIESISMIIGYLQIGSISSMLPPEV